MGRPQVIVLDTSALLFAAVDTARLSTRATEAIEEADQIVLSSISIWEIALKAKRQKLKLPFSVDDLVNMLREIERVEIVAVTEAIWLQNVSLDWEHQDPADRTIVATALLRNCPLLSNDARILQFYPNTIW
jgi:PIN domain nuclease of toxin-antitoxin system